MIILIFVQFFVCLYRRFKIKMPGLGKIEHLYFEMCMCSKNQIESGHYNVLLIFFKIEFNYACT